jgi:rSAM/selenodomain-associated transferase 2
MISVIVPTLNEERALPATLAALLRHAGDYEVIVVDGGSVDRTLEITRADPRVQVMAAPRGRARQMNAGAAVARGEWLLFLHADTRLPDCALQRLNALEADAAVQAGGFRHRFSGSAWSLRLVSRLHNLRCRITRVFYGDQAMFVRRALFTHLGGFPDEPILEDLLFGERLRRLTRPVLLDDYVVTDSRKFEQAGVWLSLCRVLAILLCHELGLAIPARRFFANVR